MIASPSAFAAEEIGLSDYHAVVVRLEGFDPEWRDPSGSHGPPVAIQSKVDATGRFRVRAVAGTYVVSIDRGVTLFQEEMRIGMNEDLGELLVR